MGKGPCALGWGPPLGGGLQVEGSGHLSILPSRYTSTPTPATGGQRIGQMLGAPWRPEGEVWRLGAGHAPGTPKQAFECSLLRCQS